MAGLTWLACDLKPSHLELAAALFRSGHHCPRRGSPAQHRPVERRSAPPEGARGTGSWLTTSPRPVVARMRERHSPLAPWAAASRCHECLERGTRHNYSFSESACIRVPRRPEEAWSLNAFDKREG